MYLKSIHIKNIRGIEDFKMEFPEGKEAGWHVLLGANGSGKTTVLRAIALALIGPTEFAWLHPNWETWVKSGANQASVETNLIHHWEFPNTPVHVASFKIEIDFARTIEKLADPSMRSMVIVSEKPPLVDPPGTIETFIRNRIFFPFTASFGPYRRFSGGNPVSETLFEENPKIGAHLTLFKDDVSLNGVSSWLVDQLTRANTSSRVDSIDEKSNKDRAENALKVVKRLLNKPNLLANGYTYEGVDADGMFFKDGTGAILPLKELSEGSKSVLSIAVELIRLISISGEWPDLESFLKQPIQEAQIRTKGLVMIDEIDVHLHPDWQARIGLWFRENFPKIQFIVATHSPLVVRAAGDDGQIWWLPGAGSEEKARLIENGERNRLVYGNILDAYGTEVFGEQNERSQEGQAMMEELAKLETAWIYGEIDDAGKNRIAELKSILQL